MRVIVTHEQPDFDALAGLALARLAHPGAVPVIDGDVADNVRAFIHLYRDQLDLRRADEIDMAQVEELIVVDTNDPDRLGPFGELATRLPVTLYDHHPRQENELLAAHGVQELVGATATLLTRHLQASAIAIPAEIASLALLAIHEDTGNFTFDLTTPHDFRAAAHLLSSGASLQVVREFETEFTDEDQQQLLQLAREHARVVRVGGYRVVTAAFDFPTYVRNASGSCNALLTERSADAALMAVNMEGKTLLFARALRGFDVAATVAEALGGGGHPGAASAKSELPPQEALERALEALEKHVKPALSARQIMTSPVKTVDEETPVYEAQQLLTRFGHNGAPVLGPAGDLTGIISRRDLDRAIRHDLAHAKVTGFMSREVITAAPEATVMELEDLVEEHNIGRLPIVEGGRLVGIVTRSDLLAAHHREDAPEQASLVRDRLPGEARRVLGQLIAELQQEEPPGRLYLVGGTVRDALLGRALLDLDLVVEGISTQTLMGRMQRRLGGKLSVHTAFGTSTLALPSGLVVDVAAAREEYYQHPGALPEVTPSSLRKDLARRDFTVNAMAVRMCPEPLALIDPFGGEGDLERRLLRPLHPLSFIEDPTRILRGARLAGRLNFDFARSAWGQAREALEPEVLGRVSSSRLRAELELAFAESRVAPALQILAKLGALEKVFLLDTDLELVERLDEARRTRPIPVRSYLLALLIRAPDRGRRHIDEFHWPRRLLQVSERLAEIEARNQVSAEWLDEAEEPERELLRVLSPELEAALEAFEEVPRERRLRGRDVLELGLPAGPEVGEVLSFVAEARQRGQTASFDDELELARRRVEELLEDRGRE